MYIKKSGVGKNGDVFLENEKDYHGE